MAPQVVHFSPGSPVAVYWRHVPMTMEQPDWLEESDRDGGPVEGLVHPWSWSRE